MNDSRIVPVFQALAEDIHALGVRTVFGLMSDDTAVFAVTLDGLGVRFVGARHENNAIAMAEGYALAPCWSGIVANLKATVVIQHDMRDIGKLPAFPAAAK